MFSRTCNAVTNCWMKRRHANKRRHRIRSILHSIAAISRAWAASGPSGRDYQPCLDGALHTSVLAVGIRLTDGGIIGLGDGAAWEGRQNGLLEHHWAKRRRRRIGRPAAVSPTISCVAPGGKEPSFPGRAACPRAMSPFTKDVEAASFGTISSFSLLRVLSSRLPLLSAMDGPQNAPLQRCYRRRWRW